MCRALSSSNYVWSTVNFFPAKNWILTWPSWASFSISDQILKGSCFINHEPVVGGHHLEKDLQLGYHHSQVPVCCRLHIFCNIVFVAETEEAQVKNPVVLYDLVYQLSSWSKRPQAHPERKIPCRWACCSWLTSTGSRRRPGRWLLRTLWLPSNLSPDLMYLTVRRSVSSNV